MIGNLTEQFLYERLPDAVINGDEKGYIEAVISGYQDRLEDVRSYAKKLDGFWTPGATPDGAFNVILVDLTSEQGKTYTRSLDLQTDTPAEGSALLPKWASLQLGIPIEDLSNVRYGFDALRNVDVNTLSWLAATLGAVLYQTTLLSDSALAAAQVDLVETWFPRLKFKGTAQSFEVLGRILGFDDVRMTPLWTRLSPRVPDDVGDPLNDPDFQASPEYLPRQEIGPFYDPFVYRDGPFFSWTGTASNGTNSTSFYTETITKHNPWVNVVLLGTLAGTTVPAIYQGTVTHPATGSYALAGGAPYFKAYVDPLGSSIRFQAIAEGSDFNGVYVHVVTSGTLAVITIEDRLSAIKYRSSYFDLGLTADMDKIEDIFGSRAATTNQDLKANGTLTNDGTAVSPYRPWVNGSIEVQETLTDWVTSSGSNVSVITSRRAADPSTDRQLNMDELVAAGVQATQAFEEVRAATRLPRRSQTGFLIDDPSCYAPYVNGTLLFTSEAGTTFYSGSSASTPLPGYVANLEAVFPSGAVIRLEAEINPLNQNEYLYGGSYPGTYAISGSYDFTTGSYGFSTTNYAAVQVNVHWTLMTTEVIRPEPSYTDKSDGTVSCLARPEDEDNGLVYEVADDYPWRREIVVGGELVELDSYQSGSELGVDVLEEATAFNDQTGVDLNVFGITSPNTPHPRSVWQWRSTVPGVYRPAGLAVGYSGAFKSLSSLTAGELELVRQPVGASVGDTETDYDVLFEPGYGLYHVGLAQGVMVADLPKFFGAHHSQNLVGWFAFNEHLEGDLTVVDHSFRATPTVLSGVAYTSRQWDAVRGWCLSLSNARVEADEYRDVTDAVSLSFWIKVASAPSAETTIVDNSPLRFALDASGSLVGYAMQASGTEALVGQGWAGGGDWRFVYLRRDAETATFGVGDLGASATETALSGSYAQGNPDVDTLLYVQAYAGAAYHVHDLRIWNADKSAADMDLVRYHAPTPTLCTYRLGFVYTLDRQDRFGVKVLPSGWADLDALPAWYRRTRQGLVRRYDSMGSYSGETRFKEVGIGDHRPLPSTYVLGQQFVTLVAEGTAPFSTDHGQLPGWNPLWQQTSYAGTYDVLPFSGSTSSGITPVATFSGSAGVWPNTMVQTNPFRQYVFVNELNGSAVYQVSLVGSRTDTWLEARPVVHGRTGSEVGCDPYLAELLSYGTIYMAFGTGVIQGTLAGSAGTYGFYDPVTATYYPKTFNTADLYTSDLPTGAYVLLSGNGSGVLVAHAGTQRGVAAYYSGTDSTPPLYLYTNSRIVAQVGNAFDTWTEANAASPLSNDVDVTAMPSLVTVNVYGTVLNTPVLGKAGVLEFNNNGTLIQGPHELTVVSGQVGQADTDFSGFAVEINVNDTIFSRRLLRGLGGYNFRGTDTFQFTLNDSVAGNYLLSFDWTNPAEDVSKGTKRQLAVFGYSLRRIITELFEVTVLPSMAVQITPLYTDNFSAGTTPGGWFNTINSYGTSVGYQHEADIYSANDTVTSSYPLGDTLTALTNDRVDDVIYTGTEIVVSDAGSFVFPTFGSVGTVASGTPTIWQVGSAVQFMVAPVPTGTAIYSYVWDFWDGSSTATDTPFVTKVVNIGGQPGTDELHYTCRPVAQDGSYTILVGTLTANSPPTILPGVDISTNDAYFSFATQLSLEAIDLDYDAITFAWYVGTTFVGVGTTAATGLVDGTWAGNGTRVVNSYTGTRNYIDYVVSSDRIVTCYVADTRGGTSSVAFALVGDDNPDPTTALTAGVGGVAFDASTPPTARIGVGQVVDITAFVAPMPQHVVSFLWNFSGSNHWTMSPSSETGTTSLLTNGGFQNTVRRDISSEVVSSGTSKVVTAEVRVVAVNTVSSQMSYTTGQYEITLVQNSGPSAVTVLRNGGAITGDGPIGVGDKIEFSATATDPNFDVVFYKWTISQPFAPNPAYFWGPKFVYETSQYTSAQAVVGTLTVYDRLGASLTVVLPATLFV